MKIGFIGLGIMGTPMSTHLLNAGHAVVVYDIVPQAVERSVSLGAKAGTSCQDVASQVDVVISMVPDSPDVEKVYLAPDGVLAGVKAGTLLIDMSTISPTTAIAVAEAAFAVGQVDVAAVAREDIRERAGHVGGSRLWGLPARLGVGAVDRRSR